MSLILIAIVQSLLFSAALSQGTCKETSDVKLTFYGMVDGGDTTAFSCGNNGGKAGGTGSYSNPETFATSRSNSGFTKCEIVYIPYMQKYFQFSDYCVQCDTDYSSDSLVHLDLWIGSDTSGHDAQITCEVNFGAILGQTIIQSPPSTLPVNPGALWDGTSCHDVSSSSPSVYPNPSTSGLCSGGSSSGGGSPVEGQSSSSSSSNIPSSSGTPSPTPTPSSTPTTQASITPVVPTVSSSSSPSSSSATPSVAPTTLVTLVVPAASSESNTVSSTTSSMSSYSSNTADCASWHGCIGDPCQTFDDCTGDWICMGTPKTCHDNRLD